MGLTNLSPIIAKIQDQPNWYQRRLLLQITKQWSQIVGTAVSQQTRPTGIYRQVLQVAVANSAWSQALMFERRQILAKLQPYLNKEAITDIHFSTAKWQTMSKPIAIPELLEHHPSYIAPHQHPQFIQLPLPPTDALNAFQRLTQLVKTQTAGLPKCPRCRCAAPLGELKRWQMCSSCFRQEFIYSPQEDSRFTDGMNCGREL